MFVSEMNASISYSFNPLCHNRIVIFCADEDAAEADSDWATPLRAEGLHVVLEHSVEWNLEDAAVADAVAEALEQADAVIFVLSEEFVSAGCGGGSKDGNASGNDAEKNLAATKSGITHLQNNTARYGWFKENIECL